MLYLQGLINHTIMKGLLKINDYLAPEIEVLEFLLQRTLLEASGTGNEDYVSGDTSDWFNL